MTDRFTVLRNDAGDRAVLVRPADTPTDTAVSTADLISAAVAVAVEIWEDDGDTDHDVFPLTDQEALELAAKAHVDVWRQHVGEADLEDCGTCEDESWWCPRGVGRYPFVAMSFDWGDVTEYLSGLPTVTDVCCCGHVEDEHDGECQVDGCPCVHYDWDGEEH